MRLKSVSRYEERGDHLCDGRDGVDGEALQHGSVTRIGGHLLDWPVELVSMMASTIEPGRFDGKRVDSKR